MVVGYLHSKSVCKIAWLVPEKQPVTFELGFTVWYKESAQKGIFLGCH